MTNLFSNTNNIQNEIFNFVKYKFPEDVMIIINDHQLSDISKLQKLKAKYNKPTMASGMRTDKRIQDIQGYLNLFANKEQIFTYLDVGAAEGKITSGISKYLQLDKLHTYACDILPMTSTNDFNFIQTKDDKLPFFDSSFDLISVFMASHHFTNLEAMYREIFRIMKHGGFLIIREHDLKKTDTIRFYDIVHALYATVFEDEETPEHFMSNYIYGKYAVYKPKQEWIDFIKSIGFKQPYVTIDTNDQFDAFYAIFQK